MKKIDNIADLSESGSFSSFTKEIIGKAFPGQHIYERLGSYIVALSNGKLLVVNPNWEITIDQEAVKELYPNSVPSNLRAAGAYNNGVIKLSDFADVATLNHETFHAARDMALSVRDIQTLEDKYDASLEGEEKQADAYAACCQNEDSKLHNTVFGRLFAKIRGFLMRIRDAFVHDSDAVFRSIRRGDVWSNTEDSAV